MATDNSNALTVADALQAEDARYKAQIGNDFEALDRLFAKDLVYIHSSTVQDTGYLPKTSSTSTPARCRTPRRASPSHCAREK
jgi:hypothetical protein